MATRARRDRAQRGQPADLSQFEGKTVLITGGTGSLGNAITDLLLRSMKTITIRILSRDELKQQVMHQRRGDLRVSYLLGDVRDRARLHRALNGVELVIHAAALKQVPACEYNPFEAVQTNVVGSQNLVDACIDTGVRRMMSISTDKAVNPVNLYGATKLCSEKIVIAGNSYASGSETKFSVARYGNVVGSRGSVIPLFLKQRRMGKVTITDERMTRFWITLPQAAELVAASSLAMEGGEIFVPKMPSMRITDLARAIAPDAEIEVTGIRPGEKIHETLVTAEESAHSLEYADRFVILPDRPFFTPPQPRDGCKLPADFRYTSDTNSDWLEGPELAEMVEWVEKNGEHL